LSQVVAPTDTDDEVGLADWLEATMLVEQRVHMPRARIRKYVRSLFAIEDEVEITVDVLLREISRRQRLCPAAYPFADHGTGVRYVQSPNAVPYLFLLSISVSKRYREEARYRDTDELFDYLVLDALTGYVGKGSCGVRFGAPKSGKRPPNFRDAIGWLAKQMNLPLGRGQARPTGGDGGLDVIVWRQLRDKRSGFLILLAQCTVQKDWVGKAKDLQQDVWRGWIDFGKEPHLVLAIPFVVPLNFAKWDELRRTVHTVLDRLRLCELLEGDTLSRQNDTAKWIAGELKRMQGRN